jgi:signal transduction histidine kinase
MLGRRRAFIIGREAALSFGTGRYRRGRDTPAGLRPEADDARLDVAYRPAVMLDAWLARLRELPPCAVDVGLALAVAAALVLTISIAEEPDATRSPDVLAYLLGVGIASLLLLRRRWPLGVLIGSVGLLSIYYGLDYPAFSSSVALAVPAYSAAVAGRAGRAALLLGAFVVVGGTVARLDEGESLTEVLRDSLIIDAALLAAVLLLGEAVRNRRAWAEEVRARLARAEEDREREAERRVQQERLRIAREMHDVLAHTLAAINVQAGVGADVIDEEPERARGTLQEIRRQIRAAIAELRATIGVLREGAAEAPRAPVPGLAELDGLVETAAGAGLHVDVSVAGAARPLPGAVDLAAYRIVQESLTNVIRHARASHATVSLRYDPQAVVLEVRDDGSGDANGASADPDGHGLVGMRERALSVGGTLHAGATPAGGFRVRATLPTRDGRA